MLHIAMPPPRDPAIWPRSGQLRSTSPQFGNYISGQIWGSTAHIWSKSMQIWSTSPRFGRIWSDLVGSGLRNKSEFRSLSPQIAPSCSTSGRIMDPRPHLAYTWPDHDLVVKEMPTC